MSSRGLQGGPYRVAIVSCNGIDNGIELHRSWREEGLAMEANMNNVCRILYFPPSHGDEFDECEIKVISEWGRSVNR